MDFWNEQRKRAEEYQKWLDSLVVGNKVFVSNGYSMRVATVTKITAKRRDISVRYSPESGDIVFSAGGGEKSSYSRYSLQPYNDETIKAENERVANVENLTLVRNTTWREVSADKLAKIAAILKEGK